MILTDTQYHYFQMYLLFKALGHSMAEDCRQLLIKELNYEATRYNQ